MGSSEVNVYTTKSQYVGNTSQTPALPHPRWACTCAHREWGNRGMSQVPVPGNLLPPNQKIQFAYLGRRVEFRRNLFLGKTADTEK